jgi:hypothetical protein
MLYKRKLFDTGYNKKVKEKNCTKNSQEWRSNRPLGMGAFTDADLGPGGRFCPTAISLGIRGGRVALRDSLVAVSCVRTVLSDIFCFSATTAAL